MSVAPERAMSAAPERAVSAAAERAVSAAPSHGRLNRPWLWWGLVVALAAATAAVTCREVVASPRDTILCNYVHPDCLSNHWLMVWVADQLQHGRSLLHNDAYYWPVGDSPWLAGNGSEGFFYLPWHVLLPWPLASNVYLLLVLTLNGVAAAALARAAGASRAAALAAAPAGAALVYCVQELGAGRFSQVSVCWLAFFLAAWLRFLDRGGRREAFAAAALLALTCLFYWYYGFFGVLAGAFLLGAGWLRRGPGKGPGPRDLATFALAFLVLVGPLLWVFLANWSAIPGTGESTFPHRESVGDSTWPAVPFLASDGRHAGRALPATICLLALLAFVPREGRWKATGLFLVGGAFALLMAGTLIPNGPYEWVYGLAGPLRRFWWPYRHVVVLNLALIGLGARGADVLLGRLGRGGRWVGLALALSIPFQLEVQRAPWHAQFSKAELPTEFYTRIGAMPGEVLLEPPISSQVASSQSQLLYQLDHHKQLLAGHAMWVKRVRPPAWDQMIDDNSFLAEMERLERGKLDGTFQFAATDLQSLIDRGLGVVTVNREYFPLPLDGLIHAYEDIFTALFGRPVTGTGRQHAWDLANWNGHTEVSFHPWTWPDRLRPGGPTLPIQAVHHPSLAFYIPVVDPR